MAKATKNLVVKQIAKIAVPILKKNDVIKAGIFGSAARGKMKRNSDIDILVKTRKDMSLLEFAGIKVKLEEKLKMRYCLMRLEYYEKRKPIVQENWTKRE